MGLPPRNARTKRSPLGIDLVRLLVSEGRRIFTVDQARAAGAQVGLKTPYLLEALYHLRQTGWIISVRRGLYAISSAVPGISPAHEYEIAMALVKPSAISHWSALHHHGLTEQAQRKVYVLTGAQAIPRTRGEKAKRPKRGYPVGATVYQFVQVKPERFFGTQPFWVGETQVMMTDPERTLLDGLTMPQYCGDFAEVLHAFELRGDALDLDRLIGYGLRLEGAVTKRLGWVLEHQGMEPSRLVPLLQRPVSGYRTLDPTGPRQGPYDHRWMIQENLPGRTQA